MPLLQVSSGQTISHLLSPLQSITLLGCSLSASPRVPAAVLDFGTVLGCSSAAKSRSTLCSPADSSTPGFPALHSLPESAPSHIHRVGDAPLLPSVILCIRVFSNESRFTSGRQSIEFQLQH
ncbi:unnamed protein product [Rangifer tarandus platyrhynchus]|uniref:Uncharacterized protein n=1 Tax=Rangifer tarandus platyrhynchus TaxID=3082113 RepID=A0ABN8YAY8_RANTA|nr:unnamed protein product [Rangifer tarandus platyrhynchus]